MASEKGSAGSVWSSLGLALVGTTCCALPITLVALGAGGAVASLASNAPWLIALSKYKGWTFAATAAVQAYAWWRQRNAENCGIDDARRLRWQRRVLIGSTALLLISLVAAYAAFPLAEALGA